jgi:hypothetical protein
MRFLASLAVVLAVTGPAYSQVENSKAEVAYQLVRPTVIGEDGKQVTPLRVGFDTAEIVPRDDGQGQILRGYISLAGQSKLSAYMEVKVYPAGNDRDRQYRPDLPQSAIGDMVYHRVGDKKAPEVVAERRDGGLYAYVMPINLPPGHYLVRVYLHFGSHDANGVF